MYKKILIFGHAVVSNIVNGTVRATLFGLCLEMSVNKNLVSISVMVHRAHAVNHLVPSCIISKLCN